MSLMWMVAHALAGGWSAGEVSPLAVDGPVSQVEMGLWDGEPAIFAAEGTQVRILVDGAEVTTVSCGEDPLPEAQVVCLALGQASPDVVSVDGVWSVVPDGLDPVVVPVEPTWTAFLPDGFVMGMGERTIGIWLGTAFVEHELPVSADRVGAGDLDEDGCFDLVVMAADGSEGAVVRGECSGPTLPTELHFGDGLALLTLKVGDEVDLKLVDDVNGWTRFAKKDGPRSLEVGGGRLVYQGQASDIGTWRVPIQIFDGEGVRWTGVVVKVESNGDPLADAKALGLPPPQAVVVKHEAPLPPREKGPFAFRECLLGAGMAGGVSKNAQSEWTTVGLPDVVPSLSPAVTMVCSGGAERVRWFLGADSAPTFFYLAPGGRMNHVLAGTLGVEWRPGPVRVGPFVNAGLVVFGFGLRTAILPFENKKGARHGIETRVTAYPSNFSGQVLLAYNWEFGKF